MATGPGCVILAENPPCPSMSHLPASQIPEGISGGSWHSGQAGYCSVGVSMLARPPTGDGSRDTKINDPVPRHYTKERQIRLLGFYGTIQRHYLGATFHTSAHLGIKQRLQTRRLGACLLLGNSRCCTQQHLPSLPVNLCQSFACGKNILW